MTALAAGRASGRHSTARIEVLTTWAEFAGLADPWDELAQESQSGPFVSHRWLSAWFDSFGRAIAPRIVQIWRDGLLVAAAPVGISTESLSARLPFVEVPKLQMLSNHRTGYNEWLVAPGYDCEIPVLLDAVMRRTGTWSVAELEPFRRSTVFDRVVAAAREQNIRLLDDTTINSGFVDLSKGWEGYLAGRPREFRKNLRVAQRRLAATNHSILRAPSSETRTLERVLSLSARSWKGRAGTALGAREGTRTFMRRLWSTLGRTNAMDLYLLEIDGREAASFGGVLETVTRTIPARPLATGWRGTRLSEGGHAALDAVHQGILRCILCDGAAAPFPESRSDVLLAAGGAAVALPRAPMARAQALSAQAPRGTQARQGQPS
jgi:hypothetical protein